MRTLQLIAMILISSLLITAAAHAYPAPAGYITDAANIIDDSVQNQLEALLAEFERNTSTQIAVATIPSLERSDINTYAVELFKEWGIGKKGSDNGVLLVVAPQERKWRIEVGYGLEGVLTDAHSGMIGRAMLPYFKQNDFTAGITHGVKQIVAVVRGEQFDVQEPGSIGDYVIPIFIFHWIISALFFSQDR